MIPQLPNRAPGEAAAQAAPSRPQLDRALARGVAWTGAMRWVAQVVSWVVTLALARLLSPADYGLFGLAMVVVGFFQLINEFGLGAAIIRRRDLTEPQIAALGGLSLALGCGLWLVSLLCAPAVARFYEAPELQWPLVGLSGLFIVTAIKVLPKSLLVREMAFRRVAAMDASEAVLGNLAVLAMAAAGLGTWALIIGTLLGGLVSATLGWRWRPHRLGWPRSWSEVSHGVTFGSHIMLSRLFWYGYSNADNATIGKTLGKTLLGAYGYGWNIASIPVDRISALVGQVTPSVFSAVQSNPVELRRYFLRVTEGLATLTVPFAIGLAAVSDLFVVALLGPKWWPAIDSLAILSFAAAFRSISTPLPHVLQAVGESGRALRYNAIGFVVLLPLFILGSRFGLAGVALAWVVGHPFIVLPMLRSALRVTEASAAEYGDAIRPAVRASLGMAIGVLGLRILLPVTLPDLVSLVIVSAVGALLYLGIMWFGFRANSIRLLNLVRELRR